MAYPRLLLPGPRGSVGPNRSPLALLLAISVLAGLVAAGLIFIRGASRPSNANSAASPASIASAPADSVLEDLDVHMRNSRQSATAVAEDVQKAQKLLRSIRPDLERSYMALAQRRCEAADASLSRALESVQRVLDELTVASRHAEEER